MTFTTTLYIPPLSADAAASLTAVALPTEINCATRMDWVPYIVQPGDTFTSIAQKGQISPTVLLLANCLSDNTPLVVGKVILVPPNSRIAPLTSTPLQAPLLAGVNAINCTDNRATILGPQPGSTVRGVVNVFGVASIPNFSFYKLEILTDPLSSKVWNVGTSPIAIPSGQLGRVDTTLFEPGIYWLQLTVVDNTSNYPPPCAIRLSFVR